MRSRKGGRFGRRENMRFFFMPPQCDFDLHSISWADDTWSVLYLLRMEAQDCLISLQRKKSDPFIPVRIPEDKVFETRPKMRIFATAMVICAGIDLLGKFYDGNDNPRYAEMRFNKFLKKYADMDERQAKTIWYLTNALMHSFGLANRRALKTRKSSMGKIVRLTGKLILSDQCSLARSTRQPVRRDNNIQSICVEHLYDIFHLAVQKYEEDAMKDNELGKGFTKMFWKIGFVGYKP